MSLLTILTCLVSGGCIGALSILMIQNLYKPKNITAGKLLQEYKEMIKQKNIEQRPLPHSVPLYVIDSITLREAQQISINWHKKILEDQFYYDLS
jgi:hypothetical protein